MVRAAVAKTTPWFARHLAAAGRRKPDVKQHICSQSKAISMSWTIGIIAMQSSRGTWEIGSQEQALRRTVGREG